MPAPIPSTSQSHRLFFALWPDARVRQALAAAVDASAEFRGVGRRVPVDKYHLTLHFLGGWPELPGDVLALARRAAASLQSKAFHLVVDRAGGFRGARVGWLAPAGNSGLDALWSDLRRALDDADVPHRDHDRFAPHVTVLRSVPGPLTERVVEPISWPVEDFVLVHSHDGHYDVVDRWALAAG